MIMNKFANTEIEIFKYRIESFIFHIEMYSKFPFNINIYIKNCFGQKIFILIEYFMVSIWNIASILHTTRITYTISHI